MKPTPEGTQIATVAEAGSRPYLLDTSALLSFIEDEAGADRVEQALKQPTTIIPWPVLLEMHYITLQEKGEAEAYRRTALVKQLDVKIPWEWMNLLCSLLRG